MVNSVQTACSAVTLFEHLLSSSSLPKKNNPINLSALFLSFRFLSLSAIDSSMVMTSSHVASVEQAELQSLITEYLALTNALSVSEAQSSATTWSQMIQESAQTKLPSVPKNKAKLVTINGCKLHTYDAKLAPYPVCYDQQMLDSDICDRFTLRKICRNGLTMHDFGDKPPNEILDIATGTGSWVIEAAAKWKDASLLVGFDLVAIQPASSLLHDRIRWVQGNILDGLPFADQTFDFVRMSRIAMGLPETQWNQVIEDAVRVLRPGGVLEIIEEDSIFPFQPTPDQLNSMEKARDSAPPSSSSHADHDTSGSSVAGHSVRSVPQPPISRRPISIMIPKTLNPRTRSRSLGSQNSSTVVLPPSSKMPPQSGPPSSHHSTSSRDETPIPFVEKARPSTRDPRDHTILHQAWHNMLDDRFIMPKPTSLLSFYLPSHPDLQSVLSHEPIQVVAPRPSFSTRLHDAIPSSPDEDSKEITLAPMGTAPVNAPRTSGIFTTKDAGMHLRQSMQVVLGCAEALWEQATRMYPNMRRDDFDRLLRDFELDMLDRIDTRSALMAGVGWCGRTGRCDLEEWRERAKRFPPSDLETAPLICRTIRGFVAIKTTTPPGPISNHTTPTSPSST
ncbi:hypothetical protein FS842_008311 [Serendipita sp. 407]|nr:hypothetical protein FS842_008311 [Serendipita sp. 407]